MNAAPPHAPFRDPDDRDATVIAVLGPTNTGKTHYAIERMLAHRSGVMGFPLRLLAREVYDRVVALRGPRAAALITGEEKIAPAGAQYVLCTVESMPLDWGAEFVAVDEIQLCADPDRGHIFTDRLLRARGAQETLFLGSDTMRARIAALIPKARFVTRPRFSRLEYAGSKKISRLPPRSAVVAFSTEAVYALAELIRRQKGGAAVVTGALSPRTRNAQVALYQNGDVQHLVATDAIGMGLNLDLRHVAFAGLSKFDGRRHRALEAQELAQIAGRAGRHLADGAFGVTGEAPAPDPDIIDRIVSHRFDPAPKLHWRNARLDMGAVPALLRSLEAQAPNPNLVRAREAEDMVALRALWADPDIQQRARGGAAVRLLWDVCQTPDFRKSAPADHAALLERIYRFLLSDAGVIPSDWIDGQVARLDRTDGDIDALSKRLAHVRTWAYVANRGRWLDDPGGWRERTRAVEDRLSDALHARLTQRFVDRRTSVLMQRLKQKERLVAEVSDTGEVIVEGHAVGRLEGFRFRPDPEAGAIELKTLKAASQQALQAHLGARADKFYNAPDTEIDVTDQGGLMWGADAVGRLEPGPDPLSPSVRAFVDEGADPAIADKVTRRLTHWIERRIKALFEPLTAMRDDPAMTGLARGVGFQLIEALGVLPRRAVQDDIKQLDQEGRALLRKHGVRFGQHHVFMPALLKPAPTRFRLLLWALHAKFDEFPSAPPPGLVTIAAVPGAPEGFYPRAGYRLCGSRALRIDMLERLADMIRQRDARAGFEAAPEMLSITGCTLEQFAELMTGLGYAAERGERPKPRPVKAAKAAAPDAATAAATEGADPEAAAPEAANETETTPDSAAPEAAAAETAAPAEDQPAEDHPADDQPAPAEAETAQADPALAGSAEAGSADPDSAQPGSAQPAAPVETEAFYTFTLAPRRPPRDAGARERPRPPRGPRARAPAQTGDAAAPAGSAPAEAAHSDAAPADAARAERPERSERPKGERRWDKKGERRWDKKGGEGAGGGKGGPRARPERSGGGAGGGARRDDSGPRAFTASPAQDRAKNERAAPDRNQNDRRAPDPDSPFAILKALRDKL